MTILWDEQEKGMTAKIYQFPDTLENKMQRSASRQAEIAKDVAGFSAYVYQRGNCGMSLQDLKTIGFMGWSMEQLNNAERLYQGERNEL